MANRLSRIEVGIPQASFDGRYRGRYPHGDAPPTAVASAAASSSSVTAALASNGALADWLARSSAAGVLRAQRFTQTTDVTNWTHNDGSQVNCSLDTSDGIIGDGCLKIAVPTTDGSTSGQWHIPLDPAWNTDGQGIGNRDLHIQFRAKLGINRLIPANGDQSGGAGGSYGSYTNVSGGFKICIIGGYKFSSPSSSSSDVNSEVVVTNPGWFNVPVVYNHNLAGGVQRFQEGAGGFGTTQQPARDRGAGFSGDARYCVYHGPTDPSAAISAGCWFFAENVWDTYYLYLKQQTPDGSTGNRIRLQVARAGDAGYTTLFDETNCDWPSDSTDAPGGNTALWLLQYDSHRTTGNVATLAKYDQVITSTSPIAFPAF